MLLPLHVGKGIVNPVAGESMNVCSLSGRLTWRPELRYRADGKPELTFRLTVLNGERDGTQFYGCVPPFTQGVIGHEIGLVLGRELRPLVHDHP
jgi:hypothetical protein